MRFPDAFKPTPLIPWHGIADPDAIAKWHRLDGKIRLHNMARRVALIASKAARRGYLEELSAKHPADFMTRFRRCTTWYWRRQRFLRDQQQKQLGA